MAPPLISLIAAHDLNRGIGRAGKIPWHLPADLRRFKALTQGHAVIMGRKTYESIGRLLPNRTNIIVTRNPDFAVAGARVVPDIEAALTCAKNVERAEIFIIGGGEIYRQTIGLADKLYLTVVQDRFSADAFFPAYDDFQTVVLDETYADETPPYRYLTLMR